MGYQKGLLIEMSGVDGRGKVMGHWKGLEWNLIVGNSWEEGVMRY
jgi:hypothetical protein